MPSNGIPAPGASGPSDAVDRLLRNTIANFIGRFWAIGVSLLLVPYTVSRIGLDRFGLWSLIAVLTGYVGLLDFGLSTAYVKKLSEHRARGDDQRLNEAASTGLAVHLAVGLVAAVASLAAAGLIARLLQVPPAFEAEGRMVLGWGLALFALGNAAVLFPSLVVALQRMDLSNRIAIAATIPQLAGTVLVLELGWGLRGLLLVQAVVTILVVGANAAAARRLLPALRISPRYLSRRAYRELIGFGMKLQAVKIADVLTFQTDRILLARFANMNMVGLYQIGSTVAMRARQQPLVLVSAVLPFASELSATGEEGRLRGLYERGSHYLAATGLPLMVAVALFARPFVRAWMGEGFQMSATILQILAAGHLASMMHGLATQIGAALDRPDLHTRSATLTAVATVALSLALVKPFGAIGVAVAASVSLIVGPVYYFRIFHGVLGVPVAAFFRRVYGAPALASALAVPAGAAGMALAGWAPLEGARLQGFAQLAAGGLAFTAVYGLVLWRTGYVSAPDRDLVLHMIRMSRQAPAMISGLRGRRG